MTKRSILFLLGGIVIVSLNAQTLYEGPTNGSFIKQGTIVDYTSVGPTDANWETGYQTRVNMLVNAKTWPFSSGNADPDDGKREWSKLLAELYKVRTNAASVQSLINGQGQTLQNSQWAGSFFKPFSDPGYTLYYFAYNSALSATQKLQAENMVKTNGFTYMAREDGHMDPIYAQTEKNSENFNWMARLPGYLWANKLNDASQKAYFDSYVKNWVRSMFNTERVEWNSCNYFGYTFNACLVLYEYAQDQEVKKRAKAALDWQVINLAMHWIDGTTTGADVRAKDGSYKTFYGCEWLFGYLYFADSLNHPSYTKAAAQTAMQAQMQMCGFIPYSSYRPPQVALDIAHRAYTIPVELHSAKPFYQADYNNYSDWKGATSQARRFDFETLYLEKDYTLGSDASFYPAGIECFFEQSLWKLCVRGSSNGGTQIFGNATGFVNSELSCGRSPYEEIGQYRNVMMRMLKGANAIWVGIPNTIPVEFNGDVAFANMGNDVYIALKPYNTTGKSNGAYSQDAAYTKYVWNFTTGSLGALVLEVGTKAEHGSYNAFKTAINTNASFATPGTDQIEYTSTSNKKLKLEFQPLAHNYVYWTGPVNGAAYQATIADAGVPPKVWCDGQYLDFSKWQSWHVSSGDKIIEQNWGSGALTAWCNGKGIQIIVDSVTANVEYRSISGSLSAIPKNQSSAIMPSGSNIWFTNNTLKTSTKFLTGGVAMLFNVQGKLVAQSVFNAGTTVIKLSAAPPRGTYFCQIHWGSQIIMQKVIVSNFN